jgi:lipoprotein-anchoring transpeptidase ErfK/SrfK
MAAAAPALLLLGSAAPSGRDAAPMLQTPVAAVDAEALIPAPAAIVEAPPAPVVPPPPPPPPPPPTRQEAFADGVLIVVSIPSQRLFVFRDGEPWASSPVSTGKRGKETPVGTFPILQKQVEHRSTLYDDAPMPYMQRLTWGGVALHAGRVPGYPASHGCIRLPHAFAKKLYRVTRPRSTAVIVTDEKVRSSAEAALQV